MFNRDKCKKKKRAIHDVNQKKFQKVYEIRLTFAFRLSIMDRPSLTQFEAAEPRQVRKGATVS